MTVLNTTGLERLWSHIMLKLGNKVDKVDGSRLITSSEAARLESLVLGDSGQVEISGKVNADNVDGLDDKLALKVDKVSGKGLSTNDCTTNEKNKLAGIDDGANKTIIDSALSDSSTNPVQNKVINDAISNLSTLVGDIAVSEQIGSAIEAITPSSISAADAIHSHGQLSDGVVAMNVQQYDNVPVVTVYSDGRPTFSLHQDSIGGKNVISHTYNSNGEWQQASILWDNQNLTFSMLNSTLYINTK